jgi:hypothetical protein
MDDDEQLTFQRAQQKAFVNPVNIPFDVEFTAEEFGRITQGLTPQAMEDKWAITYQEPYLDLTRSWTGIGVYRLQFSQSPSGHKVIFAVANRDIADKQGVEYSAAMVDFLLSNLLLGLNKPFPKPADMANDNTGLLQHHIAGTGYAEKVFDSQKTKKPWWKFW